MRRVNGVVALVVGLTAAACADADGGGGADSLSPSWPDAASPEGGGLGETSVLDGASDSADGQSESASGDVGGEHAFPDARNSDAHDVSDEADVRNLPDTVDAGAHDAPDGSDEDALEDAVDSGEGASDVPDSNDTSSAVLCGNGVVDPDEACDPGPSPGVAWCEADCSALIDLGEIAKFPVRRSFFDLPTSNGLWAAVVDAREGQARLRSLTEHIYAAYDADQPTRDVLWDAYFGVAVGAPSASTWLPAAPIAKSSYVPGTSMVELVQPKGALVAKTRWFAPMHHPTLPECEARVLVGTVEVTNAGVEKLSDLSAFALLNLHMGGKGDSNDELVVQGTRPGTLVETKGDATAVYRPLGFGGGQFTAGAAGGATNPWALVNGGQGYAGGLPAGPHNDVAVGFQSGAAHLEPGQSVVFGVAVIYARGSGASAGELEQALDAFVLDRSPAQVSADELSWWQNWHQVDGKPWLGQATAEEKAVALQAAAVLKMGQCREKSSTGCPSERCHGQILASLPPGMWNIAWVRDAAYAIAGLSAAGHYAEARDALRFFLNAEMRPHSGGGNYYQKNYIESTNNSYGTWGLGASLSADYAISSTRYFGRGLEESDSNQAGPNIEWDNWGLFLWALGDYVERSGDVALALEAWPAASARTADLLIDLVDPATGLLLPDSSIWERHWCPHGQCSEPDTRKRFAYSSIAAVHGLNAAAQLAEFAQDPLRQQSYLQAASALSAAIRTQLVKIVPATGLPALAGNLEEMPYETWYLDMAAVEAINWGVVHPGSALAFGTLAAFDAHLRVGQHSPGYVRNDDPTWYDQQEWVVMDLRAAHALVLMGQRNQARTVVDWVVDQTLANALVMAELYSNGKYEAGSEDELFEPGQDLGGDYQGAIPMVGFGAGAYLLVLEALFSDQP